MKNPCFWRLAPLFLACQAWGASIELSGQEHKQGSAITLRFHSQKALSPTASGLQQEAAFYLSSVDPTLFYAILAIPLDQKLGRYPVRIKWMEEGQQRIRKFMVKVSPRAGKLRRVYLPPEADKAMDSLALERPMLDAAFAAAKGPPVWHGAFVLPVSGEVTTSFGAPRLYLPSKANWRHKGMDLEAPVGTTVVAANDGEVVLSRQDSKAYGGLIVLSHGYELCTTYMHLSQTLVKKGEKVVKGQPIAFSGASGIATGPHLHWQLDLRGIPIDPGTWVELRK